VLTAESVERLVGAGWLHQEAISRNSSARESKPPIPALKRMGIGGLQAPLT
jgi:hypothetical protein